LASTQIFLGWAAVLGAAVDDEDDTQANRIRRLDRFELDLDPTLSSPLPQYLCAAAVRGLDRLWSLVLRGTRRLELSLGPTARPPPSSSFSPGGVCGGCCHWLPLNGGVPLGEDGGHGGELSSSSAASLSDPSPPRPRPPPVHLTTVIHFHPERLARRNRSPYVRFDDLDVGGPCDEMHVCLDDLLGMGALGTVEVVVGPRFLTHTPWLGAVAAGGGGNADNGAWWLWVRHCLVHLAAPHACRIRVRCPVGERWRTSDFLLAVRPLLRLSVVPRLDWRQCDAPRSTWQPSSSSSLRATERAVLVERLATGWWTIGRPDEA
jgi:hypothetical protein